MKTPGLYIHIPFCRSKCLYCGFYSSTSLDLVPEFLKALPLEMDLYRSEFSSFDTLYIGGGTPSLLSAGELGAILEATAKRFTISSRAEITLEANPADLTPLSLQAWRRLGINRLNIGVQALDDGALAFLGRRHNRSQALAALQAAGDAGFANVGLDLIYGLPGQKLADWRETLRLALSFSPAHLSCYQLTVEAGTPLSRLLARGEIQLPNGEALADLFFTTAAELEKAGYIHYEVSNFARNKDLLSRHNQKYWDHTAYLGLGPAAHSFHGQRRWWNHGDLGAYLGDLGKGVPPRAAEEKLTRDDLCLETLFLGLRTKKGVNLRDYLRCYDRDLLSEKSEPIALLEKKGLVMIKNGCLRPTLAGLAVADSLALI